MRVCMCEKREREMIPMLKIWFLSAGGNAAEIDAKATSAKKENKSEYNHSQRISVCANVRVRVNACEYKRSFVYLNVCVRVFVCVTSYVCTRYVQNTQTLKYKPSFLIRSEEGRQREDFL